MKKIICFLLLGIFIQLNGNAQQIVIGTGTGISVFNPINRSNDYSAYEGIYFSSEINQPGEISHLAIEREDGTDTALIQNVEIYFKHSLITQFTNGVYDTAAYNLVYSGAFPNDFGSGWREVQLDSTFMYNGTDNLQLLIIKRYQAAVANTPVTPRWRYTSVTNACRRDYGSTPMVNNSSTLTTSNFRSNIRISMTGPTSVIHVNDGDIKLYPNPTENSINFQLIQNPYSKIEMMDMHGNLVYVEHIKKNQEGTISIDVSAFASGVYSLSLKGEKKNWVGKFIKN